MRRKRKSPSSLESPLEVVVEEEEEEGVEEEEEEDVDVVGVFEGSRKREKGNQFR